MYEISIIMPCHNSLPFVKETMKSLFNQTFTNYEVLLIDDGSSDGTFEYLKSLESDKENVFVYSNPIQGAGASRNIGLLNAKGDYVIFLDSDDLFSSTLLEDLYSSVVKDSSDIAICEYESFISGTNKMKLRNSFKGYPYTVHSSNIDLNLMMLFDSAPWNKLIKRKLLVDNSIQFQNCRYANDLFAVYSAIFSSDLISIVHKPLVYYRTGRSNSIQGKISKYPTEIIVPFSQLIEVYGHGSDWRSNLIFKTFLMCYRSNFNNMGKDKLSGKLWDAIRDNCILFSWLREHQTKTRLWEDALWFSTLRLGFDDFFIQSESSIKTLKKILPKTLKKYALLFSAVLFYLRTR